MKTTLLKETLTLIDESGLTINDLCEGTGLKDRWMRNLIAGKYTDPGVNKIEKLNHFVRRYMGRRA